MNILVKNLLVPGGLGFIGSHTVIDILEQTDIKVIIVDNMSNCFKDVLSRIKSIASSKINEKKLISRLNFHQMNILDLNQLDNIFLYYQQKGQPIDSIMHFAAKKAIGQSFQKPLIYYENNVVGSLNLFKMMEKYTQCKNFIFSSTAGVYGNKDNCIETDFMNPGSPYGQSKMCVEKLISSLAKLHTDWKFISLRYFNPCGAHKSGLIGDEPFEYPNNLFPYIQQVIIGKRQQLNIFGNDYETSDGTCIRDYIHISDLSNGHILALKRLSNMKENYQVYNLGSSKGYSVLQIVKGFQQALGKPVKHIFGARRQGDVPKLIANTQKAYDILEWKATKSLEDMCKDAIDFILKRYKKQNQFK